MGRGRAAIPIDDYVEGVRAGDRAMLGRAITLVESRKREHQERAQELLGRLLPHTGAARRLGVTGVPGAGKSTFIETFGSWLTARGHRLAVLAVDPSSARSGGSILGDKTRMPRLAADPNAFVRPSPTGGTLGGVAARSREALLLCEAAGYDVVIVETVGVGQSEITVAGMVDFLLLLVLAGAGDELQGIKRGILELVDLVAINKADADPLAAGQARAQLEAALRFVRPASRHWQPPVLTASGREGEGLEAIWDAVERHRETLERHGELEARRRAQRRDWLWSSLEGRLLDTFRRHPGVAAELAEVERAVEAGALAVGAAVARLMERFTAASNPKD